MQGCEFVVFKAMVKADGCWFSVGSKCSIVLLKEKGSLDHVYFVPQNMEHSGKIGFTSKK